MIFTATCWTALQQMRRRGFPHIPNIGCLRHLVAIVRVGNTKIMQLLRTASWTSSCGFLPIRLPYLRRWIDWTPSDCILKRRRTRVPVCDALWRGKRAEVWRRLVRKIFGCSCDLKTPENRRAHCWQMWLQQSTVYNNGRTSLTRRRPDVLWDGDSYVGLPTDAVTLLVHRLANSFSAICMTRGSGKM